MGIDAGDPVVGVPMQQQVIAVMTVALLGGVAQADVKVGARFVELDATAPDGAAWRLADHAGSWVLYTFGASWCVACKKELPAYAKIAARLPNVTFVSVLINDTPADGKKFFAGLRLAHVTPVFMPAATSKALAAYDPDHLPSTFVIDPHGVVRLIHKGFDPGDEAALLTQLAELTK
jgi:peroxiredoxin